jgi:hypothetical protein
MSKFTYEYSNDVPKQDKAVLEGKKGAIHAAIGWSTPIFWAPLTDSKGRLHYRALHYSDRSKVLCQIVIEDIRGLRDDLLKQGIINGDFKEQPIT